ALLLGSGVSRSANVLTGWEITIDLIKKLARAQSTNCEPEPAAWFTKKYGSPPHYGRLLSELAKNPTARHALLSEYFQPTEEERASGIKVPTPAHRAIAKLMSQGFIRVAVTTNFDRLLERALQDLSIDPLVWATSDQIAHAPPLVHVDRPA